MVRRQRLQVAAVVRVFHLLEVEQQQLVEQVVVLTHQLQVLVIVEQ